MSYPEDAPYVCPGCYAVAGPCLPGCIDAEIAEGDEDDDWQRRYPCSACGSVDCEYTWADECPGKDLRAMLSNSEPKP